MSTGGTSIDRTDDIHPDNDEIARQAAMVVGLDIAGIDFIAPDISQSVRQQAAPSSRSTPAPGFRMHTHPTEGHPRHVGRAVIDMLFPPAAPAAFRSSPSPARTARPRPPRMIAHIMKTAGQRVGMTTTDGIYIDGTQIMAGDMSGPTSAQMVLKNPTIDYAVLETARGGILRSGLGFDRCDIAVVTNVTSDHLGLRGIDSLADLAKVKAVVPQSVFRDGASRCSTPTTSGPSRWPAPRGARSSSSAWRRTTRSSASTCASAAGPWSSARPRRRDDHHHRAPA